MRRLQDINADIEKRIAASAASSVAAALSPECGANRNSTACPANPKTKRLAKQMENDLLKKGYQANSVFTDYSELGDANKGRRDRFATPAQRRRPQLLLPSSRD